MQPQPAGDGRTDAYLAAADDGVARYPRLRAQRDLRPRQQGVAPDRPPQGHDAAEGAKVLAGRATPLHRATRRQNVAADRTSENHVPARNDEITLDVPSHVHALARRGEAAAHLLAWRERDRLPCPLGRSEGPRRHAHRPAPQEHHRSAAGAAAPGAILRKAPPAPAGFRAPDVFMSSPSCLQ